MNNAEGITRDESYWRKLYKKLKEDGSEPDISEDDENRIAEYFDSLEIARVKARDHRVAVARRLREQARAEEMFKYLQSAVTALPEVKPPEIREKSEGKQAVYAMVSDLHYGLSFSSVSGSYSPQIARERMERYAYELCRFKDTCKEIYVSFMGDMISGGIHYTARIEERENVVDQVIGAAELCANFLYILSSNFETVYVNNVNGNHSRVERSAEDAIRGERLDVLIPWFCKARLAEQKNIFFKDREADATITSFTIFDKLYVAIHGDYDADIQKSAIALQRLFGKKIDYILSAHMHVPEMRIEETGFIRNGCVCGPGDDYTIRKRLFGVPSQVALLCGEKGVEAVYPIVLN